MAPGGGFFADGGMCLNSPIDAAEYPQGNRLYVYGNVGGYSRPNIRTIRAGYSDDVYYASSGSDYMWIYWNWGGYSGSVTFQLRDGTSVRASISCTIVAPTPPPPTIHKIVEIYNTDVQQSAKSGSVVPIAISIRSIGTDAQWHEAAWEQPKYAYEADVGDQRYAFMFSKVFVNDIYVGRTPPKYCTVIWYKEKIESAVQNFNMVMPDSNANVRIDLFSSYVMHDYQIDSKTFAVELIPCTEGEKRYPETCWDGSTIHYEECKYNKWISTGEECPTDPCEGVICEPECFGFDYHNTVCEGGSCVQADLIMANDPDCGYISPTPEDNTLIDLMVDNKEMVVLGTILGAVALKSI